MSQNILDLRRPQVAIIPSKNKSDHLWLWNTFKWLLYFAFVAGLIWGLPSFLSWKLHTSYPIAAITSGSMWPELKRGDLALIEGVSQGGLKVGDVVVWQNKSGAGFVIHRVARINSTTIVTKGDGNFTEDEPVSFEQIMGRAVVRDGKTLRMPYLGFMSILGAKIRDKI